MNDVDNGIKLKKIESGKPCGHPGCLHHITHPCEKCGRIGGKNNFTEMILKEVVDKQDD